MQQPSVRPWAQVINVTYPQFAQPMLQLSQSALLCQALQLCILRSSDAVTGQPLVIMHITQCRSACNALMVITVPFNTVKKVKDLGFWRRHNVGCRYNSLPSCFRALCAVVLSPSANTNVLNLRHYCCHVSCNTDTTVCVEVDTKLRRTSAEDVLTKERM